MLEVTILKVYHAGAPRAKQMFPYIETCDVFSPEAAYSSARDSTLFEASWDKHITSSSFSTNQFKRQMLENLKESGDPQTDYFNLKWKEYAFRLKKPLFVLERFSPQESATLEEDMRRACRIMVTAVASLGHDDLDKIIQHYLQSCQIIATVTKLRDTHIAQNLTTAEQIIRDKYHKFKSQEPLQLTAFLGAEHNPECYLSENPLLKVHTQDLAEDEYTSEERVLSRAALENHSSDDVKKTTLICILSARNILLKSDARQKTYEELREIALRVKK